MLSSIDNVSDCVLFSTEARAELAWLSDDMSNMR